MLEGGIYLLAMGEQSIGDMLAEFRVTVPKDGVQYADCLHGSWCMKMWMEGDELVGKVEGWPHSEFSNIRGQKVDSIPEDDSTEQICF